MALVNLQKRNFFFSRIHDYMKNRFPYKAEFLCRRFKIWHTARFSSIDRGLFCVPVAGTCNYATLQYKYVVIFPQFCLIVNGFAKVCLSCGTIITPLMQSIRDFPYLWRNFTPSHLWAWMSSMTSSERMESLSRPVFISMLLSFSTVFPWNSLLK